MHATILIWQGQHAFTTATDDTYIITIVAKNVQQNLGIIAVLLPNSCILIPILYKLKTLLLIMLKANMKRKKNLTFPSGRNTYSIKAADVSPPVEYAC